MRAPAEAAHRDKVHRLAGCIALTISSAIFFASATGTAEARRLTATVRSLREGGYSSRGLPRTSRFRVSS